MEAQPQKPKLFNKNFSLLWQGQLISELGNAAFNVVIGFWVLQLTGSKAAMGSVMACFALPAVLLGPLAGTLADRANRKAMLVLMDLIRGLIFAGLAALVLVHSFQLWMLYPVAILVGICAALFTPTMGSSIPDLVPRENLSQANSLKAMSTGLSQIVGSAFGGAMLAAFSAPVLFLINGVSFLYAAVSQLFIRIPRINPNHERKHFLAETKDGIRYVWQDQGLRRLLLCAMVMNFFSVIGITLFIPLFKLPDGFGEARYGFTMAVMIVGSILGSLAFSIFKVKHNRRFTVFAVAVVAMIVMMVASALTTSYAALLVFIFLTGLFNIAVNMTFQTVVQLTTPQAYRGKVFGIIGTITGALSPVAMAVSGFIAQAAGVRPAIAGSFVLAGLFVAPLLLSPFFRKFINEEGIPAGQPVASDVPETEKA